MGLINLGGFFLLVFLFSSFAYSKVFVVSKWRGQNLSRKFGLFQINIDTEKFTGKTSEELTGLPLKLYLKKLESNKIYLVSYILKSSFQRNEDLWKIPVGKFDIFRISFSDGKGVTRNWLPSKKNKKIFMVKSRFISQLGSWSLIPFQKRSLKIINISTNKLKISSKTGGSLLSTRGIINGFNGKWVKRFSTKRKSGPAKNSKVLSIFNNTKQIGVFYGVVLNTYKKYRYPMLKIIKKNDLSLRNCYLQSLRFDPKIQGRLTFSFKMDPRDQILNPLKKIGGNIADKKLIRCIYYEVSGIKFPYKVPVKGQLVFKFLTTIK